ncbi:MAG: hypothetical protein KDH09_02385 [Chrysiogenetes bacterium]|nr:hypothetical protein [Chrysiogenetes bacterium]
MSFNPKGVQYRVVTFTEFADDDENDNQDVEVEFETGERFGATFFTVGNLLHLMEKDKKTGECGAGLYFWASYPIFVQRLTKEVIEATVRKLIDEEEFLRAFESFPDRPKHIDAATLELSEILNEWHPTYSDNGEVHEWHAFSPIVLGMLTAGATSEDELTEYLDDVEPMVMEQPRQPNHNREFAKRLLDWWLNLDEDRIAALLGELEAVGASSSENGNG